MTRQMVKEKLEDKLRKGLVAATSEEVFAALLSMVKEEVADRGRHKGKKKLYYISAEFLIGKLLSNHLINLGIYEQVKEVLCESGKSLEEMEEMEPEPSLGNGGLGRLAACFLDSIATLGLPGDGIGLNYHFGLFKQRFEGNEQVELPNPWITKDGWLRRTDKHYDVQFCAGTAHSRMYDLDVSGYENGSNVLHLFDLEEVDEDLVEEGIRFDKEDVLHNLTLFLYPDDSDVAGNLLRIYQQYFMVSNAAQFILDELEEDGYDVSELNEHVVIQINDTHPSLIIPELIRLMVAKGMLMDDAIDAVGKTCAYTNHTILAEALEKWPMTYLDGMVPRLVPIIKELDNRVRTKYKGNKNVYIVDKDNRAHMARMDMHYGFSVNGVAALHTEILKKSELAPFYKIYPEKFNNKTNGIAFRRWLQCINPDLTELLVERIGNGFKKDAGELKRLLKYKDDKETLQELIRIKKKNKVALKEYLRDAAQVSIDEDSIFDIQIKRLHEYKRQQMNALYVIYKYKEIKKGNLPRTPITVLFGAKAAPAYTTAKDIIHLILCLQELVEGDEDVNPYLRVVMVENYNVTWAQKLIPACDVSEQISLASQEASGTGNMKFMLNGAVTLGTEDGANVEIHELVGDDNIYIFGEGSDEVMRQYDLVKAGDKKGYSPLRHYLTDDLVKELVDFMVGREMLAIGNPENLLNLHKEMLVKDWFMTMLDLKAYIKAKEKVFADYENRMDWAKKMLVNIAMAGYFSSDRTIEEYNRDIWKLGEE